jgi:hypothetical protein
MMKYYINWIILIFLKRNIGDNIKRWGYSNSALTLLSFESNFLIITILSVVKVIIKIIL